VDLVRRRCWNSYMRQVGLQERLSRASQGGSGNGSHEQAEVKSNPSEVNNWVCMSSLSSCIYKITASDLILSPYTKENRKTTHSINLIRKKSKVIIHGLFLFLSMSSF